MHARGVDGLIADLEAAVAAKRFSGAISLRLGADTAARLRRGHRRAPADRLARNADLSEVLHPSANGSGGVHGKLISPQNLAIGAAASAMAPC